MIINRPKVGFILLTLIVVLLMTSACYALSDDAKEIEKNDEYRSYAINSMTILESLDHGDTNLFMLLDATPKASTSQPTRRVSWHQADYYRVAQALHQQSRQEPLGEQNLYSMSFTMDCAEIEQGTFRDATFSSFKTITNGKEETRVEYSIVIKPSENLVRTYKGEFTPNGKTKEPLNCNTISNFSRRSITGSVGIAVIVAYLGSGSEQTIALQIDKDALEKMLQVVDPITPALGECPEDCVNGIPYNG